MPEEKKLNCYIIGTETLCLECAKTLQKNNFDILAIISQDKRVISWSQESHIKIYESINTFLLSNSPKKCDYLFSIVNPFVLHDDILKVPQFLAVNYHDSLLPSYAGVHATSWAILNGEKQHGVTWHILDEGIDTGDILLQHKINIDADDTAFSLNMKCHEAAINSFKHLVKNLKENKLTQHKQNLNERSYFGYHQKPNHAGLITWKEGAEYLDRLIRALNFGEYPNELAVPKLQIADKYFIITELHKTNVKSLKRPGTVIKVTAKSLQVTTATVDIIIETILYSDGQVCNLTDFIKEYKIKPGYCFEDNNCVGNELTKIVAEISSNESFWVKELEKFSPTPFPYSYLQNQCATKKKQKINSIIGKIPHNLIAKIASIYYLKSTYDYAEILFATFLIYLARITQEKQLSVGIVSNLNLSRDNTKNQNTKLAAFFSDHVPFNITIDVVSSFKAVAPKILDNLKTTQSNSYFLQDLFYRYPNLKNREDKHSVIHPLMQFKFVDRFESFSPRTLDAEFLIEISTTDHLYRLSLKTDNEKIKDAFALLSRITQHVDILLKNIINAPNQSLYKLNLLTEKEKNIIHKVNNTKKRYAFNSTIPEIFQKQVHKYPNKIALIEGEKKITYKELDNASILLASYLLKLKIKPQSNIGIYMERSLDFIVAALAILKIRCVYVPLDTSYPAARIEYIFKNCDVKTCLVHDCTEKLKTVTSIAKTRLINVDNISACENYIANKSNLLKLQKSSAQDVALIIHTSGSTGIPKGIQITHCGINRIVIKPNYIKIRANDYFSHLSNVAFDASLFEIWGALLNGASLHIISKEELLDIRQLSSCLKNCTIVFFTPAFFNQVVQSDSSILDNINYVVLGGDHVNPTSVRKLLVKNRNKSQQTKIINGYGPTESTIFATNYSMNEIPEGAVSIPIGKPVNDTSAYILDNFQQLLPIGVIGELYLGGDGLATGYVNAKDLTNKSFISNINNKFLASRLYKTGDCVRLLPNGNLDIIGRKDNQIKLRGFRIELQEIESVLKQHPCVDSNLVLAIGNEVESSSQLLAFVTLRNKSVKTQELRQFIAGYLPAFMVPSKCIIIKQWPLTPNGKIDRQALIDVANKNHQKATNHQNQTTKLLISVWEKVLNHAPISTQDNFFELGGESIIALKIVTEAAKSGIKIKPTHLFQYPTIAQLTKHVQVTASITGKYLLSTKIHGQFNLTPIQKWLFETGGNSSHCFNNQVLLLCKKTLDVPLVEKAFLFLLQHHDSLRTTFHNKHRLWYGFINKEVTDISIDKVKITLTTNKYNNCKKWIDNYLQQHPTNFDLSYCPLLKIIYFSAEKNKNIRSNQDRIIKAPSYLSIVLHHLIVDGVSWHILLEDFECIYNLLLNNQPLALPPKTSSFLSWSKQIYQYAKNITESERLYWQEACSNIKEFPHDFCKGKNIVKEISTKKITLSAKNTDFLTYKAEQQNALKTTEVLLSSIVIAIYQQFEISVIHLNLESYGREHISNKLDLSRTVGWFTSIFPVCFNLSEIKNPSNNLKKVLFVVKKQLRNIPKLGVGYGILRYLNQEPKYACNPAISFNYWGNFDNILTGSKLFSFTSDAIELVVDNSYKQPHLIDINCWIVDRKLHMNFSYSKNYYQQSTIESLTKHFTKTLRSILNLCHQQEKIYIGRDFPLANLSDIQLENLLKKTKDVQDVVPLNSLQQGLLFHTIYETSSNIYLTQTFWQHQAKLNAKAFKQAWQHVIDQHASLRSSFVWENLEEPLQIIHNHVELSWQYFDWSKKAEHTKNKLFDQLLKKDRKAKFNLVCAPLMRVVLIKNAENNYQIIWSHHHIILDGWSVNNILGEVYTAYKALCIGSKLPFNDLPNHRDYLVWLHSQNIEKAKNFWLSYLQRYQSPKFSTLTSELKDHKTNKIIQKEQQLSVSFTDELIAFAKQKNFTLNSVVQCAWAVLLAYYSRHEDVIFNTTLSVRPSEINNINSMTGLLLNTFPFRLIIKQDSTIADLIKAVQTTMLSIGNYSYVSLADVQSWCEIDKDNFWSNSLFVFENYPFDISTIDKNITNFNIHSLGHYPLTLVVYPRKQIIFNFIFDETLISNSIIANMMRHLQMILECIINRPKTKISKINFYPNTERQPLPTILKNTAISKQANKTVIQIFEEQVNKYPNNVALVHEEQNLTYQELNQRANQLANFLRKQEVKPNTLVALLIDRSISMIISILGILKAGGAYVPIDINCPPERFSYILENSQASILVTRSTLLANIKDVTAVKKFAKVVCLDTQAEAINKEETQNPGFTGTINDLIYVIYTSGSTGKPKGVLLTHVNVARLLTATQGLFKFNQNDVWALFHSYAFDFSVWEIWGALLRGGKLIVVPSLVAQSPEAFYELIIKHQITVLNQTPTAFKSIIEYEKNLLATHSSLFLRYVIFGGEALDYRMLAPWVQKHQLSQIKLINMYGITETTVHVTYYEIKPRDLEHKSSIIGKALPDLSLYILDKYLRPVPKGLIGELYVGGAGVARGYLNLPQLTAEKFVLNPFNQNSQSRLYKTGDLVRMLDSENLEYCGRLDNQVKIRGFRIELGEIRTRIISHQDVEDAVVLVHNITGGDALYSYIVVKNKSSLFDPKILRDYLKEFLPHYMIPVQFILIDNVPLNFNGKIDTGALRKIALASVTQTTLKHGLSYSDPIEGILVKIWQKLLGVQEIDLDTSFFDLGGHSLLALKLLAEIYQCFAVKLDIRILYTSSTISALSHEIRKSKDQKNHVLPADIEIPCPVVRLKSGKTNYALFLVHPVGGTIFWFASLARYLSDQYSLYGIYDPGIETGKVLFSTFEKMASFYIQEIKKIQRHGPYLLGGASFGATLAVEMAKQLQVVGEQVIFVALLDGWAKVPPVLSTRKFLEENMARQYQDMQQKLEVVNYKDIKPIVDLHWHRAKLLEAYEIKPVDLKLTLFKAQDSLSVLQAVESPHNHWDNYASSLKTIIVPGNHESMFYDPNVMKLSKKLCEEITACINYQTTKSKTRKI